MIFSFVFVIWIDWYNRRRVLIFFFFFLTILFWFIFWVKILLYFILFPLTIFGDELPLDLRYRAWSWYSHWGLVTRKINLPVWNNLNTLVHYYFGLTCPNLYFLHNNFFFRKKFCIFFSFFFNITWSKILIYNWKMINLFSLYFELVSCGPFLHVKVLFLILVYTSFNYLIRVLDKKNL